MTDWTKYIEQTKEHYAKLRAFNELNQKHAKELGWIKDDEVYDIPKSFITRPKTPPLVKQARDLGFIKDEVFVPPPSPPRLVRYARPRQIPRHTQYSSQYTRQSSHSTHHIQQSSQYSTQPKTEQSNVKPVTQVKPIKPVKQVTPAKPAVCRKCHTKFESNNALHKHLRDSYSPRSPRDLPHTPQTSRTPRVPSQASPCPPQTPRPTQSSLPPNPPKTSSTSNSIRWIRLKELPLCTKQSLRITQSIPLQTSNHPRPAQASSCPPQTPHLIITPFAKTSLTSNTPQASVPESTTSSERTATSTRSIHTITDVSALLEWGRSIPVWSYLRSPHSSPRKQYTPSTQYTRAGNTHSLHLITNTLHSLCRSILELIGAADEGVSIFRKGQIVRGNPWLP